MPGWPSNRVVPGDAADPKKFEIRLAWNAKPGREGPSPYVRLGEDDYKVTGNYFRDMSHRERDFVLVEASLSTHPDTILRESGIVRQTGRYGNLSKSEVFYDAKQRCWQYTSRATKSRLHVDWENLTYRRDTPPSGLIRVVGDIDFSKFKKGPDTKKIVKSAGGAFMRGASEAANPLHPQRKSDVYRDFQGYEELMDSGEEVEVDETTGLGEAGDEDSSFMSDLEVAKHIKQYLSRAVPALVTQVGMMVVHNTTKTIAHQLSKGMAVFESVDAEDDDEEEEHANEKQHPGVCLCVVPAEQRHSVQQHFTHCILVSKTNLTVRSPAVHAKPKKQPAAGSERPATAPDVDVDESFLMTPDRMVDTASFGDRDDTADAGAEKVTPRELVDFINRLVESLTEGYARSQRRRFGSSASSKRPPNRKAVPRCTLLIGGDPLLAPMELMQSVTKRDCIVVIQGSKGYADALCNIIDAVHDFNPNAGLDDFQRFLGTADARTELILMTQMTGKLVVIKKGTKVEEFQRRLHACLRGDETLVKAWSKYAQWQLNAEIQQSVFNYFNGYILMVSILATFVSVLLTFLLLIWQLNNRPYPEAWKYRGPATGESVQYMAYFALTWSIIFFPIILALLQAVNNKVHPAAKWVALRVAAEDVLKQIYMYRTRTLEYSIEKCKEHDPSSPGYVKPKDGLVYCSRQELLSLRVNMNTDQLARSPVAGVALRAYSGSLPPKNIKHANRDNGLDDLNPDEYIEIRLRTKRKELQALSAQFQFQSTLINCLIHFCSGFGTCLAAIAANGFGYLQAWIAFTTAMVNSLQRYTDFSNLSRLHEQYNKTDNNLSNVEIWFAKLGESKDSMQNYNQLVRRTEEFVHEEVATWARLLQSVAERVNEGEDGRDAENKKEVQKNKTEKEVKKLTQMGFDGLHPDVVKRAFADPASAEAKRLQLSLSKLNEDMGDVLKPVSKGIEETSQKVGHTLPVTQVLDDVEDVLEKLPAPNSLQDAHSVLCNLPGVPKEFSVLVSTSNASSAIDALLESNLTATTAKVISRQRLAEILSDVPSIGDVLQTFSQRDFLECVKGLALNEILDKIFSIEGLAVKSWEVMPTAADCEDFLNEMRIILVRTEGMRVDCPEMVLAQIRDERIRDCLANRTSDELARLFKTLGQNLQAVYSMRESPVNRQASVLGGARPPRKVSLEEDLGIMFGLVENCSLQIAELDIECILDDIDERLQLWQELKDLPRSTSTALETMSKEELLRLLPKRFRQMMEGRSVFQIATSITKLLAGTPASRALEALQSRASDSLPELSTEKIFLDPVSRECFVMAAEHLCQKTINSKDKGELIRLLRVHPSFKSALVEDLYHISDSALKKILSGLQALFSNSFSGRLIDRLNDELTSFDVNGLLDFEDRDKLAAKLREFRDVQHRLMSMDRGQLMSAIGYPKLQQKLGKLSQDQLLDLVFTMAWLMRNNGQFRVWNKLVHLPMYSTSEKSASVLAGLSEEVVEHIFSYAAHMNSVIDANDPTHVMFPQFSRFTKQDSSSDLLHFIGDSFLTSALITVPPRDIVDMLIVVKKIFGDPMVSDVFETVGGGMLTARRVAQYNKYGHWFLAGFAAADDADTAEGDYSFYKVAMRRRAVLLRGLENICLHEIKQIQEWQATSLVKAMSSGEKEVELLFDEIWRWTSGNQLDDTEVTEVVWRLLSELTVSLPYKVFCEVCDAVDTFDARDIIDQLPSRYFFALLVTHLNSTGVTSYSTSGTFTGSRKDVLAAVSEMEGFDTYLSSELRELTAEQFDVLFERVNRVLSETPGGRFLTSYCARLSQKMTVPQLHAKHLENLGVALFKNRMRTLPGKQKVKQLFRGWDADSFATCRLEDKYGQLCQFLEDGDLVATFQLMKADQLELVFAHLKPLEEDLSSSKDTLGDKLAGMFLQEIEKPAEFSDDDVDMFSDDGA